ncbi:urease accessory protein UreH domain-containing protein [Planococcus lenghuensis]|uniref:Cytochrome C biosynthesis protein n=1 Tax=Planococcus lenghuensis TaxID=2213202 RepID=A0A1Q2KYR8_9BACL|nr:sulfite exporter TauE/SafE family protein [Planococcus lenghuensis]AQQ53339.1 cytochrome C biosynthesis protein [Planococcus lenghuensis]
MYTLISQLSSWLMDPFLNLSAGLEGVPLVFAFLLGIIGAMAPCQFTGNIGAVTYYGNKSLQQGLAWRDVLFFNLGKITVFTGLGLLVWLVGSGVENELTAYFPWIRKMTGPLFIIVGTVLLGVITIRKNWTLFKLPDRLTRDGKAGSFLLGAGFSLGFCPTMFILFFFTLMPVALGTPYGLALPGVFAIGTSLPLFIAIFLIWYYGAGGAILKKGRKVGLIVQRVAGVALIVLGILDTLMYWTV